MANESKMMRPAAAQEPVRRRPAASRRPAANSEPEPASSIIVTDKCFVCPLTKCHCTCSLAPVQSNDTITTANVITSEEIEQVTVCSKRCSGRNCGARHRPNFFWTEGTKFNCLTFNQIKGQGVYFVTNTLGFSVKYLEFTYERFMRARTVPGQEAHVRRAVNMLNSEDGLKHHNKLRNHLKAALEGYALARRQPDVVLQFDIDAPHTFFGTDRSNFLFPPTDKVSELCFDGHFGVHRALEPGVDAERTVRLKGRPCLKEKERIAGCVHKDKAHVALPQQSAGWQFVLDPAGMKVLGGKEHLQNECIPDKLDIVMDVMSMDNVDVDVLVHDDSCTVEKHVKKSYDVDVVNAFKQVKYYIVDTFHQSNHKCAKRIWTPRENRRMRHVRTNMAEAFNSWIRRFNFFLNHLLPSAHRFWVWELIAWYNDNVATINLEFTRPRTNAATRKRPSSAVKRPSASRRSAPVKRRPAAA